jgi:hypothetical protein
MIDLRKAKVGDLFKRRDGRTVRYQGSCDTSPIYKHYLADEAYADWGAYFVDEPAHTLDIVAKVKVEAPKKRKELRGIYIGTSKSAVVTVMNAKDYEIDPSLKLLENCTIILDNKPTRKRK